MTEMVEDFHDDFLFAAELGTRSPPAQWTVEYTSESKAEKIRRCKPRQAQRKNKRREQSQRKILNDAAASSQDLDVLQLPPHLLLYGRSNRTEADYSGPSLLDAESEEGCVEYKLRLTRYNPTRFQQLVTQLKFRLSEGYGTCFYCLGVEDNGHPRGLEENELQDSISVLQSMAAEVHASTSILQTPPGAEGRHCAVVCVRWAPGAPVAHEDLRIAVAGGVGSGKSTLVAVLSHGSDGSPLLDNGRGAARMNVLRHKHEIETGRTSSISHQLVGYAADGRVLNYWNKNWKAPSLSPREVSVTAAKVARFSDLGGHERFSKTSLYGMTCTLPDYAMLCVCAETGLSWVTMEHLAVALALGVPPFVVLTKVDTASTERVHSLAHQITLLAMAARRHASPAAAAAAAAKTATAGSPSSSTSTTTIEDQSHASACDINTMNDDTLTHIVSTKEQALDFAAALGRQRAGQPDAGNVLIPVFPASSVTGDALPLLHVFLNALPSLNQAAEQASTPATSDTAGVGVDHDDIAAYQTSKSPANHTSLAATFCSSPQSPFISDNDSSSSVHFQVESTFDIAGVGLIVGGTLLSGRIAVDQRLLLGPADDGSFAPVFVKGIQRSHLHVDEVLPGQHATLAVEACDHNIYGDHNDDNSGELSAADAATTSNKASSSSGAVAVVEPSCSFDSTWTSELAASLPTTTTTTTTTTATSTTPMIHTVDSGDISDTSITDTSFMPSKQKCQSSEADLAALWRSWDFVQRLRTSSCTTLSPPMYSSPDSSSVAPPGLSLSPLSPAAVAVAPSLRPRKGAVLVHPSAHPLLTVEFEAIIVLLGGNWPARGLVTGRYPPDASSISVSGKSSSESDCASLGSSPSVTTTTSGRLLGRSRSRGRLNGAVYTTVVHCGGVRQAAKVESMEEVVDAELAGCSDAESQAIISGLAAAGVLASWPIASQTINTAAYSCNTSAGGISTDSGDALGNGNMSADIDANAASKSRLPPAVPPLSNVAPRAAGGSAGELHRQLSSAVLATQKDLGCVARVKFSFVHRPEWLLTGARLVLRDHANGGCVAGAGVVTATTMNSNNGSSGKSHLLKEAQIRV